MKPLTFKTIFLRLALIGAILYFLTSCTKSNIVRHEYRVTVYQDTVQFQNSAHACPGDRSWDSVVVVTYGAEPEPGWANLSGTAKFFFYEQWNGMWIRRYFVYKEKLS